MTRLTRFLIVAAIVGSMGGGAYAAWVLRDRLAGDPPADTPAASEYTRFVGRLGGDEPVVRDELNWLITTASAPLGSADRAKTDRLTRECLDPQGLLAIDHVRGYVELVNRGESPAYHFVNADHRRRLAAIAGDRPSADRVLAVRKALAVLGTEFGLVRQPPDWEVTVDGEAPPLPLLDLLRSGHTFLPPGRHPLLRPDPRVLAFGGPDGVLLAQLEQFFNTRQARAAFPPDRFPKLYRGDRVPPIPTNLFDYRPEIEAGARKEMSILLPGDQPDPDRVEAMNDTFGQLQRFLTAVVRFEVK